MTKRVHPHPNPSPIAGEGLSEGRRFSPSPLMGEGRGGGEGSRNSVARKTNPLTPLARQLRTNLTDTERHLWRALRLHNLAGHKFRRQYPLGPYIVDFICLPARLIVELDGGQHLDSEADRERDAWLVARGFRVLRFWNNDVLENTQGVLDTILTALPAPTPTPALPHQGGGSKPFRAGEPLPLDGGRRWGFGERSSPPPKPVGCAKPTVDGQGWGVGAIEGVQNDH